MTRRLTPQQILYRSISERQWQDTVIQHALFAHWFVHFIPDHFYAEAKQSGGMYAVAQTSKGFPDLVLVSGSGQVLYRELKTEIGTLSKDQIAWRDRLLLGGHDWELWRPSDIDTKVIPQLHGPQTNIL